MQVSSDPEDGGEVGDVPEAEAEAEAVGGAEF